jgi:CBS domain-containing protein
MDEIAAFLRAYPPFDQLPLEAAMLAAEHVQIEYFPAHHDVLTFGGPPAEFLYIVRKGMVDFVREEEGEVLVFDSLGPGEAFGYPSLIRRRSPIVTVRTRTEVLAYLLPAEIFYQLQAEYPLFASYFAASALHRLTSAVRSRHQTAEPSLFQTRLQELISHPLIAVHPDATVREAAQLMRDHNVSCLLVNLPPYEI